MTQKKKLPTGKSNSVAETLKTIAKAVGYLLANAAYLWVAWFALFEWEPHSRNTVEAIFLLVGVLVGWFGINAAMSSQMREQIRDIFRD